MKFTAQIKKIDSVIRCSVLFTDGLKVLKLPEGAVVPENSIISGEYDPANGTVTRYDIISRGCAPLTEIYEIIDRYDASPYYPDSVLAETAALLAKPGLDDPALEDFTALPFVTIDNENSRDLDQALYIEKTSTGFTVYYALADTAYYVKPGSAMMNESLKRGASFYIAGMSVSMLPKELSEGIISLNPDQLRRSLVFVHTLDESCADVSTAIKRGLIRSRAKLSYNGVQKFYDSPADSPLIAQEYTSSLMNLKEFGERRIILSEKSSSIPFTRIETGSGISENGERFEFSADERNNASRYNEHLSLLCNEEGAKMLAANSVGQYNNQAIYRIHASPDDASLDNLHNTIKELCLKKNLNKKWNWDKKQPLGAYLNGIPREESPRLALTIEQMVRRTFKRSAFVKEPSPHYALGVDHYTRFSSPMREVVGVFLHKELLEALDMLKPESSALEDIVLREKVIDAANRSKDKQRYLEREVERRAMDHLFGSSENRGRVYRGIVTGIDRTRIYVMLDRPSIEVKVYLTYGPIAARKIPVSAGLAEVTVGDNTYLSGDEISLVIGDHDMKENRWYFIPE